MAGKRCLAGPGIAKKPKDLTVPGFQPAIGGNQRLFLFTREIHAPYWHDSKAAGMELATTILPDDVSALH